AINQRLTPTQKFTPKDLIAAMKALNVELGLIIDLTYTTRDLPKSVQYKKLYTVGLEVPDNATILQFKKWVRKFLWENAGNGK
ncbi:DUS11 phosphatase, partial [Erpornis zantholeuca]|nr:DUS11 phosphatase [Erpornis zantholeuca]